MAKMAANLTRVYANAIDLSGVLNSTSLAVDQEVIPVTAFSDAGPRVVVGNYGFKHSDMGYFDGIDDGYDEQLAALLALTTDIYLTKVFGTAEGSVAYDSLVHLSGVPRSAAQGGAVLASFDSMGSGGLARGKLLRTGAAAVGNGTGQNLGATLSGVSLRAIFRVLAFSGTNITLKVQESSDNGAGDAYADIATLTSGALTATGIVVVTTTAATEAWKRVVTSGTFTTATILVTLGVVS